MVALHAGAWIETVPEIAHQSRHALSPSMRGRGLKLSATIEPLVTYQVALHAGAWIETIGVTKIRIFSNRRPPCGGVD